MQSEKEYYGCQFKGQLEFYIPMCQGFVVRKLDDNRRALLPHYLIPAVASAPTLEEINKEIVQFVVEDDVFTDTGVDISRTTVPGQVMYKFDNGQWLVRLPDYDGTKCWRACLLFSGQAKNLHDRALKKNNAYFLVT